MAKKITGPRIATANRLQDGLVVFLGPDGTWTRNFRVARIAHDDEAAVALENDAVLSAVTNIVVDPYLVELAEHNGSGLVPAAHRERMRTLGPTAGNSLKVGNTVNASNPANESANAQAA